VHSPFILKGVIEIVGGGLIGLACAFELGRRNIDCVVYERDPDRTQSASYAGAGMLGALAETFPDQTWRSRAIASARLYPDWIQAIGGQIDFTPGTDQLDGHVDPRDLLRELSQRVQLVHRQIESLDELSSNPRILCTGAWQLTGLPAVEPVKGYLIAWDHLPQGTIAGILRDGHTYILQRNSGRVIAGSTEQRIGFDQTHDPEYIAQLQHRAEALIPALKLALPSDTWFGFRPATAGDVPVVERYDDRTILAYGHYRNGILLAPWTAQWVADEVQRQLGKRSG
jgi:glycine/D-amino acid oxidase-like deaminating enzyme